VSHFQVSRDLDDGQMSTFKSGESFPSLETWMSHCQVNMNLVPPHTQPRKATTFPLRAPHHSGHTQPLQLHWKDDARPMHEKKVLANCRGCSPKKWLTLLRSSFQNRTQQLDRRSTQAVLRPLDNCVCDGLQKFLVFESVM
jgi:hypothetical protein